MTVSGSSFDHRICHIVQNDFLTVVFNANSAIPNLAANATHSSLLPSIWTIVSIFSWRENGPLYLVHPNMMKKKWQPESKIQLFGSLNSHYTQTATLTQCLNKQVELLVTSHHNIIHHYRHMAPAVNMALLCSCNLEATQK
jgi:hypothetical protein